MSCINHLLPQERRQSLIFDLQAYNLVTVIEKQLTRFHRRPAVWPLILYTLATKVTLVV